MEVVSLLGAGHLNPAILTADEGLPPAPWNATCSGDHLAVIANALPARGAGVTPADVGQLQDAVADATQRYYHLVLVVGPAGIGKTRLLKQAAVERACPSLNLSLELSQRLLDLTASTRSLRTPRLDLLGRRHLGVCGYEKTQPVAGPHTPAVKVLGEHHPRSARSVVRVNGLRAESH